jgi:tetratricopeptide (TPR) repeat protein
LRARPKRTVDRQNQQSRSDRRRPFLFLRWFVVGLTVAVGAYSVYRWCYLPYRCNIFKRSSEQNVLIAENLYGRLGGAMIAHRNLQLAQLWIERCPDDLELYMLAAACFRQLAQSRDAIPMYQKALSLDRRPELYLNLGEAQVEANLADEAVPNLAAAVAFNPDLLAAVPPAQQAQVEQFLRLRPNAFMPTSK